MNYSKTMHMDLAFRHMGRLVVEEREGCFSTMRKGDGFLPLFFISSFFKYQYGKRMKMGYRTWLVAWLVVATRGKSNGELEEMGFWVFHFGLFHG